MNMPPSIRNNAITNPWLWRIAWRDSRTHRKRLLLFVSAIVLGVASLVAITSFGRNLEEAVNDQAKTLLGADLMISSRQPFGPEAAALLDSLGRQPGMQQAREVVFASMAYFPKNGGTRLVQIRALSGMFPFYGELQTVPANAIHRFRQGTGLLVDQSLMLQYRLAAGDSVKIGHKTFAVLGELTKAPGQAAAASVIAPRIYLPMADLAATGLITFGSRALYREYYRVPAGTNPEILKASLRPRLHALRLNATTVDDQRRSFGNALENLYRFLNLVGFIALLLGSIGVASAVHVYIRQKLESVAILRCLGASARQTFYIFLIQTAAFGLLGSLTGVLLGVGIQTYLPQLLRDFLPVEIDFAISGAAIAEGFAIGMGMTLLFALLPLLNVRKIPPLRALRASFEGTATRRDPLRGVLYGIIAVLIFAFAIYQADEPGTGLLFAGGLLLTLGLLTGVAHLIMRGVRRFFPASWGYIWRQSLANLYRPNNQTLVLILALGLGTFLISTLQLTQSTLLRQISLTGGGRQPNLVFFDIQTDQLAPLQQLIREADLPVTTPVPIVTLRLKQINGRTVEAIRDDSTTHVPRWALMREYRVTYRDSLTETERIVAGQWVPQVEDAEAPVPISLESGIAEELQVGPGDEIVVDVQGIPLRTRIASLRQVDWQRIQPNFFIVFPAGVLEDAPQIYVLVSRTPTAEISARVQQEVVQRFPNVSAIDLTLILRTVESILSKISFVIRFMALFSILTGLLVLIAAVFSTRFQRIRESVLLRTLGARQKQIRWIAALEYFYLGVFAAFSGTVLAVGASAAIAAFLFDAPFRPDWLPVALIFSGVIALTVLLGMANSRGISRRPPLEVLRAEVG